MKKNLIKFVVLALIASPLVFTACSKEKIEPPKDVTDNTSLFVKQGVTITDSVMADWGIVETYIPSGNGVGTIITNKSAEVSIERIQDNREKVEILLYEETSSFFKKVILTHEQNIVHIYTANTYEALVRQTYNDSLVLDFKKSIYYIKERGNFYDQQNDFALEILLLQGDTRFKEWKNPFVKKGEVWDGIIFRGKTVTAIGPTQQDVTDCAFNSAGNDCPCGYTFDSHSPITPYGNNGLLQLVLTYTCKPC